MHSKSSPWETTPWLEIFVACGIFASSLGGCTADIVGEGQNTPPIGPGGVGVPPEPGTAAQTDCSQPHAVRSPLRRLTRFEYNNSVRDVLHDSTSPADALPGEESGNGFGNDADALAVSPLLIDGYGSVAQGIATRLIGDPAALGSLAQCAVVGQSQSACAEQVVSAVGERLFRRPLSALEQQAFVAVFAKGLELGGSPTDGVSDLIEALLQSPQFLYRIERGEPAELQGLTRPTDYEMASRLSYLIWGSAPDIALLDAARQAQLHSKEQVRGQAERLLADARFEDVLRFFHGQWLGVRGLDTLVRSADYYPTFEPGMGALFRQETEHFIAGVFEEAGTFGALFESDYTYVNETLARFYGLPGVTGPDFRRVTIDVSKRLGLLTQASILATTTPGSRTDPVVRGKWAFTKLLCGTVPDPPLNVPKLPEPTPGVPTRERLAQHRAVEPCKTCHVDLDPLGLAFEHYDGVGLWRDTDNGAPIDDSGEIAKTDAQGAFKGVVELGHRIASSQDAQRCYVGRWFTYAYGRAETDADQCSRSALNEAFLAAGGGIRQLLLDLTQTDAFLYRPTTTGGTP